VSAEGTGPTVRLAVGHVVALDQGDPFEAVPQDVGEGEAVGAGADDDGVGAVGGRGHGESHGSAPF
jgi:hypothetical protein